MICLKSLPILCLVHICTLLDALSPLQGARALVVIRRAIWYVFFPLDKFSLVLVRRYRDKTLYCIAISAVGCQVHLLHFDLSELLKALCLRLTNCLQRIFPWEVDVDKGRAYGCKVVESLSGTLAIFTLLKGLLSSIQTGRRSVHECLLKLPHRILLETLALMILNEPNYLILKALIKSSRRQCFLVARVEHVFRLPVR